jgi:hypothetical protein
MENPVYSMFGGIDPPLGPYYVWSPESKKSYEEFFTTPHYKVSSEAPKVYPKWLGNFGTFWFWLSAVLIFLGSQLTCKGCDSLSWFLGISLMYIGFYTIW